LRMPIQFVLLVNKQGQTRVAQYYEYRDVAQRAIGEAEVIRKCLARTERQCSFVAHQVSAWPRAGSWRAAS